MHALTSAAVPAHDEKNDAVELYSEDILSVAPNGKIRNIRRRAFKILRPGGKDYGMVVANFDSETKISAMHGWCVPAQGKDYEVKEKDALESALPGIADGELMSDVRSKILQIPAAEPGNIVGYEIEQEERPYVQQDEWVFQSTIPSREAHYTLQLPPDWEYKSSWMNYVEVKPVSLGGGQWQWVVSDVKAIKTEQDMPPWRAVAGQMLISLFPPAGASQQRGFENWAEMGTWYTGLLKGRDDASQDVKQKVVALTSALPAPLDKMRAIAKFVQHDIRYVAIQLGIGGWQPHPAEEVFNHRYGDCKDKATLMRSMLREIGVESYHVVINTDRGAVADGMPAHQGVFNHAILAIQLPDSVKDPSLAATLQHPQLGRILFFDPTNELTPFGQLSGYLQENYGLLIGPSGGELVRMPTLPPAHGGP
jgi:predicted transglutaminase-like cysteine proteinase